MDLELFSYLYLRPMTDHTCVDAELQSIYRREKTPRFQYFCSLQTCFLLAILRSTINLSFQLRLFSACEEAVRGIFLTSTMPAHITLPHNCSSGLLSVDCVCQTKVKRNKLEVSQILNEVVWHSILDSYLLKIAIKVLCQSVSTMFNLSFSSARLPGNREIVWEIFFWKCCNTGEINTATLVLCRDLEPLRLKTEIERNKSACSNLKYAWCN